jgi:hypothetical protein
MSYHVVLTGHAQAELDRLLATLSAVSRAAASRLATQFQVALVRLETAPLSCGLAYENPQFTEELRHLLFGATRKRKYRALFVVRGDEAVILSIRAPRQRPIKPDELGE